MFISLGIIFILGILGKIIFQKIKIPELIFYILLGILIGPSVLNIVSDDLINISSILRQVALIIILTRSGLSLDLNVLKQIGRPCILLSFLPATFEIIATIIFAPLILNISYVEAALLGSVLAAVSPAVVVPKMIELQNLKYGEKNHVPETIMGASSIDDIFVIIVFYVFLGLNTTNKISYLSFINIPISIILGIIIGISTGYIVCKLIKKLKLSIINSVIIYLGISFLLIFFEDIVKDYVSFSSLLAVIVMSITFLFLDKPNALKIKEKYNNLWEVFKILLFCLVGISLNIKYAFKMIFFKILLLIIVALIIRLIGVYLCLIKTKYRFKEKIYIMISYLPKATVQASIGPIALSLGLGCGNIILSVAVISILITAPLGAILMDKLQDKLLLKGENDVY